jgi:hypothetical protein
MGTTHETWIDTYIECADDTSYSPREIKARAFLYTVLGYSSRETEERLRRDFPGQKIPPFGVIARWNRNRPVNRLGEMLMADVLHRTAVLLEAEMERFDPSKANMMEIFGLYERAHGLYDRSRQWKRCAKCADGSR